MQTDTEVAGAHDLGIIVNFEPSLTNVRLLPLGVALAEYLVVHRLLWALACDDHLDGRNTLLFVGDIKCLDKEHKVFIGGVAR